MVSDSLKRAQAKYREKNVDKYNETQRLYYLNKKDDAEWREKHNEKCRIANAKYRQKKKEEKGGDVKPRGRPRKIIQLSIDSVINNI